MVTVNNSDYYNNIPAGRDLNNLFLCGLYSANIVLIV